MTHHADHSPAAVLPAESAPEAPLQFPARITFIAGTLGQGGAERQLYYMLSALRTHKVAVRVLCLTQGEFWERRIRTDLEVPITWAGKSPARWRRLIRIVQELRRDRPQVVQSGHFFTNLYAVVAARLLGLREVGAIRNDVTSEVGTNWLGRMSLTGPRLLAANSRAGTKKAVALGVPESKCIFLPNVVDTDRFRPRPRLVRRQIRLLAVGRLVEQKRFDRLLKVIAAVHRKAEEEDLDVTLSVVGKGPLQAELEGQAQELGLRGIVTFKGVVADVTAEYAEADALILTSDWEGTPNVVLEAMASGLPVIATPVGGIGEVITDGVNGLIAPDEAALVQAVSRLIGHAEERQTLGCQARAHVERYHSLQSMPQSLAALYRALNT